MNQLITIEDGTHWPSLAYTRKLVWDLRYDRLAMGPGQLCAAAAVIEAYLALVSDPSLAKKLPLIRRAEEMQRHA